MAEKGDTYVLDEPTIGLHPRDNQILLNTLAKLQTLWGDAKVINKIPDWIAAVTSADVQRTAKTYLTRENRSVIDRKPAPKPAPAAAPAAPAAEKKQ